LALLCGRDRLWVAPDSISHIRNGSDWRFVITSRSAIFNDIQAGNLAAVSWLTPDGAESDHALSTDGSGPSWVASIVDAVGASKYWGSSSFGRFSQRAGQRRS